MHVQEECAQFNSPVDEELKLPIAVTHNDLDCVKITVIMPSCSELSSHTAEDVIISEAHRVKLTEETLNHALTSHKRCMRSSFSLDYPLSRSGQAINVHVLPMLKIDCPTCQACKVNQSAPIPNGVHATRNRVMLNSNNAQLAQTLTHAITSTRKSEAATSLQT